MVTHMKTTLELPDELLIEAKAVAARRRTSLKAIMEHALRRELGGYPTTKSAKEAATILNAYNFPVLKRTGRGRLTSEMVYAMQESGELE
jgi:hypothetical protein